MFHKILIANRGEIACRVMRTARALGYRTVAVYSAADALAPHVAQADEAVCIGEPPAAESYLRIDALLDAARRTGADAVHPGYGFLSERAEFAQACLDAGLVFIGPPPAAITAMGDKALAKRRMLEAGVPCAPGYLGDDQNDATLIAQARGLGLPLLVKAVAGGGGRGMRLVHDFAALPEALAGARREAAGAFGDGTLMLERLIAGGRHIEVQVFADAHGHCIHLGERDCTAQRRRQKVIEEAPSPIVDAAMRERIGADAVAAARAVGYQSAGTVEFIVDAQGRHYFLEMNTRLQVEHPVTECITGLDLVEWQLRVAAGEPLPLAQHELRLDGHAIEVRLYAEDPAAGFVPQTGRVLHWRPQAALDGRRPGAATMGGVRIDAGIVEGSEIGPHYDPMVAKVIAHGRNRDDAIRRLRAALADAPLVGVGSNTAFLRALLDHPRFRTASLHTGAIDEWATGGEPLLRRREPEPGLWALAATMIALRHGRGLRPASVATSEIVLQMAGHERTWAVHTEGPRVRVRAAGGEGATHEVRLIAHDDHRVRYEIDGVRRQRVALWQSPPGAHGSEVERLHLVDDDGHAWTCAERSPYPALLRADDPRRACAAVAGTVVAVSVQVGQAVSAGQPLVCVEAMKMEMWQHAAADARVIAVHVRPRQAVDAGALLVELEIGIA